MEKINKKLAIVSILLAVIITGIGVSFGYFIWNSTTNTDISFTVEGAVVELSDGTDIKGANLMPVINYTTGGSDVVKKDIKIKLKNNVTSDVTVDFKLKINSIDNGLKHSSFKYNLVNASGTSISSGDFATSKAGDSISLFSLSSTNGTLTTSLTGYTLYIYIDGTVDNPSSMMNQSFDFSFVVDGSNSTVEHISAVKKVESLDDGSTGDSGSGVYKVTHNAIPAESSATGSEIPAVTDYRYYGASPNNYICLDKNSDGTCEDKHLYRIIGSMREDSDKVYKVKVIKATPLTDGTTSGFSWDCTNVSSSAKLLAPAMTSCNRRTNVWSGKEADATIMQLLNGIWLNNGIGNYYNGGNTATVLNFTNYGLSNNAKKLINLKSRYYLGGVESATKKTIEAYIAERGNVTSNGNSQYWDGMVGLMYLSDIGYVSGENCANNISLNTYAYDEDCFNKNWIYERKYNTFTITPIAASDISWKNDHSIYMIHDGSITDGWTAEEVLSVFPVFYLKSNVVITSGTGTEQDPYLVQ